MAGWNDRNLLTSGDRITEEPRNIHARTSRAEPRRHSRSPQPNLGTREGDRTPGLPSSARHGDFLIGNMIPTCVNEDRAAAATVNRRTLTSYAMLPNYRNYWREAGYEEEMASVEAAVHADDPEGVGRALSDRWLADTTLFGSPKEVREGIEAHFDAGIKTPIIVPSSANGGQFVAFDEFFSIWD